jgi:peptide/nickel transport system substrate-binding protein
VTSRDLVFWMNLMKVDPATNWCGYVPGYFPTNVTSYSAPNPSTFVITFKQAYDPHWVINNELTQITAIPLAWDTTKMSGVHARSATGGLPDTTKSGAAAVYKFLDTQSKAVSTWATSPIWSIVDGPFTISSKLGGSFTSSNQVTLVPNPKYSGSPKPSISKLVELPYTSEAAIYNSIKSGGPKSVTIGSVPSQYAPQLNSLASEGYNVNKAASYSFNYFPLNMNSNASTSPGGEPVRFIFRQFYFREAMQHLIDQDGWIKAFLFNTANPTCGPIPFAPPSPLVSTSSISFSPCSFSPSTAKSDLTSHGWKVVPGGTTTCQKPGTGSTDCGAGIHKGEGISFNIDYESGVVAVQDEMNNLASQAKKLGISINLTTHPFPTVVAAGAPCTPNKPTCKWTAENWGAGWIYGPDYLPTGEDLYFPGAAANAGSWIDPTGKISKLINQTITAPASQESKVLATYAKYVSQQDPVLFGPTSVGTYGGYAATLVSKKLGGYAANALGLLEPQYYYFTK